MAEIEINPEFRRALDLMASGWGSLFVTGKAGTGKSTLLEHFRETAKDSPVILAPTGVAALNVHGQTVHRFFGFGIEVTPDRVRNSGRKPRDPDLYKRLSTVIIDEVSMLRADLLDCVDIFLRRYGPRGKVPFGGVRMVFVGDLYQLPPVVTKDEREIFSSVYETPYFFSAKALNRIGLEIVELKKVYRQQDAGFVELLNRVRDASVKEEDIDRLNERLAPEFEPPEDGFTIHLTATNRNADQINDRKLAGLSGQKWVSRAEISKDFGREQYPTADQLTFKEGAQIMMLNNDSGGRWVNGSIGVIESVAPDAGGGANLQVRLRDVGNPVEVRRHTWNVIRFSLVDGSIVSEPVGEFTQLPFRLAWAVTIHKSQGKTFDRVVIDLERGAFAAGQTYVALSRCTTFEGIWLRRPIQRSSIRADGRIRDFFATHRNGAVEVGLPLEG